MVIPLLLLLSVAVLVVPVREMAVEVVGLEVMSLANAPHYGHSNHSVTYC
jgi:hypothetical protein